MKVYTVTAVCMIRNGFEIYTDSYLHIDEAQEKFLSYLDFESWAQFDGFVERWHARSLTDADRELVLADPRDYYCYVGEVQDRIVSASWVPRDPDFNVWDVRFREHYLDDERPLDPMDSDPQYAGERWDAVS
jgi:hypothetical protein